MAIQICDECGAFYVSDSGEGPNAAEPACRDCDGPLRTASLEELRQHVRSLKERRRHREVIGALREW